MADVRKHHSADFKRKVALEAIRQQKTMNQITAEYGVHVSFLLSQRKALFDRLGHGRSLQTQCGLLGATGWDYTTNRFP